MHLGETFILVKTAWKLDWYSEFSPNNKCVFGAKLTQSQYNLANKTSNPFSGVGGCVLKSSTYQWKPLWNRTSIADFPRTETVFLEIYRICFLTLGKTSITDRSLMYFMVQKGASRGYPSFETPFKPLTPTAKKLDQFSGGHVPRGPCFRGWKFIWSCLRSGTLTELRTA